MSTHHWQAVNSARKGFLAWEVMRLGQKVHVREQGERGCREKKRHWEQVNHRGTIWAMNGTLTGTHLMWELLGAQLGAG